ncbi:MAG: FKBP-type peptidyl-prolyl cis-trans isomerase [Verrucomicrobiota bacterium]
MRRSFFAFLASASLLGCQSRGPDVESPTVRPSDPNALQEAGNSPAAYPSTTGSVTSANGGGAWQKTYSGLQYQVIRPGNGRSPTRYQRVSVQYHGTLKDGTVFDSSYERGTPAIFAVSQVIPGWTEGLQLMKEGAKYKFIIPPNLAYGDRGAGAKIGPNETLYFTVELLQVLY